MMLMAIFKSYPTYADTALYLSLLPMWKHVLPCELIYLVYLSWEIDIVPQSPKPGETVGDNIDLSWNH